jgi:hypothetical protein
MPGAARVVGDPDRELHGQAYMLSTIAMLKLDVLGFTGFRKKPRTSKFYDSSIKR